MQFILVAHLQVIKLSIMKVRHASIVRKAVSAWSQGHVRHHKRQHNNLPLRKISRGRAESSVRVSQAVSTDISPNTNCTSQRHRLIKETDKHATTQHGCNAPAGVMLKDAPLPSATQPLAVGAV